MNRSDEDSVPDVYELMTLITLLRSGDGWDSLTAGRTQNHLKIVTYQSSGFSFQDGS
jgi:hypothetical protein